MKPSLPVIFRKWKNGDVLALFPTLPGTYYDAHTCTSYEHIGQHSSTWPALCVAHTKRARPDEYDSLLCELRSIYDDCDLRIVLRESPKMRRERYNALKGAE